MKRGRFTEEQIVAVLHEREADAKTADLARKQGYPKPPLTTGTQLRWLRLVGDQVAEDTGGREPEAEEVVGGIELDKAALKELLSRCIIRPALQGLSFCRRKQFA